MLIIPEFCTIHLFCFVLFVKFTNCCCSYNNTQQLKTKQVDLGTDGSSHWLFGGSPSVVVVCHCRAVVLVNSHRSWCSPVRVHCHSNVNVAVRWYRFCLAAEQRLPHPGISYIVCHKLWVWQMVGRPLLCITVWSHMKWCGIRCLYLCTQCLMFIAHCCLVCSTQSFLICCFSRCLCIICMFWSLEKTSLSSLSEVGLGTGDRSSRTVLMKKNQRVQNELADTPRKFTVDNAELGFWWDNRRGWMGWCVWQVCSTGGERAGFRVAEKKNQSRGAQNILKQGPCVTIDGFTANCRRPERKGRLRTGNWWSVQMEHVCVCWAAGERSLADDQKVGQPHPAWDKTLTHKARQTYNRKGRGKTHTAFSHHNSATCLKVCLEPMTRLSPSLQYYQSTTANELALLIH